ncbi:hypothetical protein DPV78_012361 [Talaromyces pinophilus]|nr:hypothetical protein DPV78_012361 [Talaromyces pinophilus]
MSKDAYTNDYVPVSEWPNAEAWTDANKTVLLVFEDEARILHTFHDACSLGWEVKEQGQLFKSGATSGTSGYKAFQLWPDIFLIDFYKPEHGEEVTLVLNFATGQAVCTISTISGYYDRIGERRTKTTFLNVHIDSHQNVKPFEQTSALVGKHILYRYTPRDCYEHVYLNRGTFTWHCVDGAEKGLADTEQTKVLALGEELYLLFWTETVMPIESVVVVDLKQMRSTGRFICWDPKAQRMVHKIFGSYATILAESNLESVLASLRS